MIHKIKDWLLVGPKRIVRILVLIVCVFVVMYQFSECFHKLRHPPKSTHSHFDINSTMVYPALTFCREPAYRADVLVNYKLSTHPKFISHWKRYPFDETPMSQMFNEGTYGESDFFYQYGLNKNSNHVNLRSSLHFNYGRCHTMKPLVTTKAAWKDVGYSVLLKHNLNSVAESENNVKPGWHLFIHEATDPFSENRMQLSGRVEHMFIDVNEEVEIKLTVQHYGMMSDADSSCTHDTTYSKTKCGEICHWKKITRPIGCTGPWMPGVDLPECDNANSTITLINAYKDWEAVNVNDCGCREPCKSVIFSLYVLNRKAYNITVPASQVWVFYTSKTVTIIEELPGYDLSQFVADMGGSLGFLLGLSVLGLIGIFEKTTVVFVGRFSRRIKPVANISEVITGKSQCTKTPSTINLIASTNSTTKEEANK